MAIRHPAFSSFSFAFVSAAALFAGGLAGCDVVGAEGASKPLPHPEGGPGSGNASGGAGQGGAGMGGAGQGGNITAGPGGSGQGACDGGGPFIETAGANTKYLLKGTLLLPAGPLDGELLIVGNSIACAAASCAGDAQATGATVIETQGVIAPGLIDAHNHILFDIMDDDDWGPEMAYQNHNQWPNEERYGAMVDTKQYLAGEAGSPINVACEMVKYGELKGLIAGTTAIQGSASPGANRACYGSLSRTIDQTPNDLPDDQMQTATLFPSTSTANGVCTNFGDGDTNAYVIHIGEGVDTTSRDEFDDLGTVTATDDCLYDSKTAIIHGTALDTTRLDIMAANDMNLIWSPKSNVALYGSNTDLTKTTNIPYALSVGINVALGPDWSMGGSQNMLDEMRFVNLVDDTEFGNILTSREIFEMATINGAIALGISTYVGTLEVGKRADIAVFLPATAGDEYDAVLQASPREVTLVFVDGRLLYGDADLVSAGPPDSICETVDICCRGKFLCIAETLGVPADRLNQTFAEFSVIIQNELELFDALPLTQDPKATSAGATKPDWVGDWKFAPIAPIVHCP